MNGSLEPSFDKIHKIDAASISQQQRLVVKYHYNKKYYSTPNDDDSEQFKMDLKECFCNGRICFKTVSNKRKERTLVIKCRHAEGSYMKLFTKTMLAC